MARNQKSKSIKKSKNASSKFVITARVFLAAYFVLLMLLTLTPFSWQRNIFQGIVTVDWQYRHNIIPFFTIIEMLRSGEWEFAAQQLIGNAALLAPLGILIPFAFKGWRTWKKVLGLGFLLSLFIEVAQLTGGVAFNHSYRIFDIDDILLNTIGVAFGYGLYTIARKKEKNLRVPPSKRKIILVLDDIRSLHNVGSFFRTGDAFNVERLYLCGITGTPDSPSAKNLTKVSLGAEEFIPWEYAPSAKAAIKDLQTRGWDIIVLEQSKRSVGPERLKISRKMALVVGNEVDGVGKPVLKVADQILELPMLGNKESLNVSVAGGIALHILRNK